ncbi:helix-turn-helix transcriptional regulator [Tropicibacter naphthalenivorans]|uniref:Methylphosphotriester-DNA--protein-cysteine S-methyltransferase n=1 Tax=Tropicibacter naphthalenivorans TaxID=441103 RepID=A0A0P1G5X7_9RHOB|nr:AraC family transcriptional regulator [Tropicibacter naphthalenivorans]CUH77160.1 Methylphosphotriester-DNA--protein-cysteine S-methyltransferase [Tropicibacter naphthalenivorans]SMC60235.1 transcriptional regulator, AraC family [Tropicibacter naphthalenivorans]
MQKPSFLSKPMPPSPIKVAGPIRAGSYNLLTQGAAWKFSLLHDRDEDVLIWVTRGQGRVVINGVMRGISMNNALFVPSGTLFSLDVPSGVQALMVRSPAGLTPRMPHEPLLLRIRDSLAQAELTGIIDAMAREITQDRALLAEALEAQVRLISVWLYRQVQAGTADAPKETAGQRLVRRYAQAITRDYASARLMADYAEALDVTPTHLSRICRKFGGRTAADMLTERKLHAARSALERPHPPIQDIASALGFSSAAYFTRFVHNHTGQSPTALRADAQKNLRLPR